MVTLFHCRNIDLSKLTKHSTILIFSLVTLKALMYLVN